MKTITTMMTTMTMRTSHFLTTVNNSLKAALVDPSQSRFVGSFGVSDELITECWEKILEEWQLLRIS